jgi:hypothetical protein
MVKAGEFSGLLNTLKARLGNDFYESDSFKASRMLAWQAFKRVLNMGDRVCWQFSLNLVLNLDGHCE